jgi:hypothetical protein
MKLSVRFCVISFLSLFSVLVAQEPSNGSTASEVYLRFANLLPTGSPKVAVNRGSKPFLAGLKAGFLLPYDVVAKGESMEFSVTSGEKAIGQFRLSAKAGNTFYTVVVFTQGGREVVSIMEDNSQPPTDVAGVPVPSRRFRGYFGGFAFPYRVDCGSIGQWTIDGNGVFVDIPVASNPPETVAVSYTTRDGDEAEIFFPLDFNSFKENSVFVSERGPNRPRIAAFPDNCPPIAESVASE